MTGFDGIEMAVRLGITTVDQHNKRKGATAGKVLYQVIEGMASTHTILPTEFIPGHSAGIGRA